MPFFERFHIFAEARFRHPDTYTVNILNLSIGAWSRYYSFLLINQERHREISMTYVEALQRQHEAMAKANTGDRGFRELTQEQQEAMQRTSTVGLKAHLEIESFYVFANILLDRIASTFRYYFWKKPNWNHMNLVSNLARICANKPLTVAPPALLDMPTTLQQHIVEYRNKRIEHVEEPRLLFGSTWGPDKKMKIHPMLIYPSPGEAQSAQQPSGDLDEIVDLLDRYMTAMLDFFDANADKSILPLEAKDQQNLIGSEHRK